MHYTSKPLVALFSLNEDINLVEKQNLSTNKVDFSISPKKMSRLILKISALQHECVTECTDYDWYGSYIVVVKSCKIFY